jgi:hypothetical protein
MLIVLALTRWVSILWLTIDGYDILFVKSGDGLHHRRDDGSGILTGGGTACNMSRRNGSIDRGAVDRDALGGGSVASLSTDVIACVVLVYTARTIGLYSTIIVLS